MIAPIFPVLHADPTLASKKKRVLLVDSSRITRDLRSETMRRLGAEVDCAADISEARCWWRADIYDLVLMNVPASKPQMEKFCDDVRRLMPEQRIMFLVGKPDYLAAARGDSPTAPNDQETEATAVELEKSPPISNGPFQTWGILEACRRIAAVRSKMDARTRAIRALPGPKRDSESSRGHHKNDVENPFAVPDAMEKTQ